MFVLCGFVRTSHVQSRACSTAWSLFTFLIFCLCSLSLCSLQGCFFSRNREPLDCNRTIETIKHSNNIGVSLSCLSSVTAERTAIASYAGTAYRKRCLSLRKKFWCRLKTFSVEKKHLFRCYKTSARLQVRLLRVAVLFNRVYDAPRCAPSHLLMHTTTKRSAEGVGGTRRTWATSWTLSYVTKSVFLNLGLTAITLVGRACVWIFIFYYIFLLFVSFLVLNLFMVGRWIF